MCIKLVENQSHFMTSSRRAMRQEVIHSMRFISRLKNIINNKPSFHSNVCQRHALVKVEISRQTSSALKIECAYKVFMSSKLWLFKYSQISRNQTKLKNPLTKENSSFIHKKFAFFLFAMKNQKDINHSLSFCFNVSIACLIELFCTHTHANTYLNLNQFSLKMQLFFLLNWFLFERTYNFPKQVK